MNSGRHQCYRHSRHEGAGELTGNVLRENHLSRSKEGPLEHEQSGGGTFADKSVPSTMQT
jgi:hypothetical protein